MLELRPNCESCDINLPPDSSEAYICSYECTFCIGCVKNLLMNVCPNCGGGFVPRPIRPATARRAGVSLGKHPASSKRVHTKYSNADITQFGASVKDIEPGRR